jgi:dethiobiotin synthetase
LFSSWGLELLLVAADRLGALNHTLLTIQAADQAGLVVKGVVLNRIHSSNPAPGNAAALRELIPGVPVIEFPCIEPLRGHKRLHEHPAPVDFQALALAAESSGLLKLLAERD